MSKLTFFPCSFEQTIFFLNMASDFGDKFSAGTKIETKQKIQKK